jgi:hypothetical protein
MLTYTTVSENPENENSMFPKIFGTDLHGTTSQQTVIFQT